MVLNTFPEKNQNNSQLNVVPYLKVRRTMFFYIRNLVALQQSLSLEDKINVFLFPQQSATTAVASAHLQLFGAEDQMASKLAI